MVDSLCQCHIAEFQIFTPSAHSIYINIMNTCLHDIMFFVRMVQCFLSWLLSLYFSQITTLILSNVCGLCFNSSQRFVHFVRVSFLLNIIYTTGSYLLDHFLHCHLGFSGTPKENVRKRLRVSSNSSSPSSPTVHPISKRRRQQ